MRSFRSIVIIYVHGCVRRSNGSLVAYFAKKKLIYITVYHFKF